MGENQGVRRIKKLNYGVEWSRDHVTEGILCLLLRQGQKQGKKQEVQVFLMHLLVPLPFADLLRFCLILETSVLGLTIGLTIGEVESISGKFAVGLSRWFW